MIAGKKYYFFRLDRVFNDPYPDYKVGESVHDLFIRHGHLYMSQFQFISQLNEVTIEHIRAIDAFLLQQIS